MLTQIQGLHHVTSMAADARENNRFFTETLGLRRVKKTVNFDAPDVYHLYYGDEIGTPGSVMTYFPFQGMPRGRQGTGEVGVTEFAVPKGALGYWTKRLSDAGVSDLQAGTFLGENRLEFAAPDGERFALVEDDPRERVAWTGTDVPEDAAILGFRGARFRLQDHAATAELIRFMGYQEKERAGNVTRFVVENGNAANVIDLEELPDAKAANQGAGSVHHIAFAVQDRAAQAAVRRALLDTRYAVTPVIDRNYFWAIYFRTPGGILFEIATNEPGFDHDEDTANLGTALKLPHQHEPKRAELERHLPSLN